MPLPSATLLALCEALADDALDGAAVAVAAKLNTVKASARTYLQKKGKHGGVDQSGALFDALM